MFKVEITGWSHGAKKIAATKEIREKAGIRLKEAHRAVDRVIGNESVSLPMPDQDKAKSLAEVLMRLGFVANHVADAVAISPPIDCGVGRQMSGSDV